MKPAGTKTITMMALRHHIGEVVNDVSYTNQTYIVEKHGKPICIVQPYVFPETIVTLPDDRKARISRLFGAIKQRPGEPVDWTEEYDEIEKDYDERMKRTWEGKR